MTFAPDTVELPRCRLEPNQRSKSALGSTGAKVAHSCFCPSLSRLLSRRQQQHHLASIRTVTGFNAMLLRTLLPLLLCVSVGTCATLGHYQADGEEGGEAPAANSAALTDAAAAEAQADDTPASEGSVDKSVLEKLFALNNPEDVQQAAEEPERDAERPAGDVQERTAETNRSLDGHAADEDSSRWSLSAVRSGFQTLHGYFDSLVELVGGHDGVCRYRCRYGGVPQPRSGYRHQEPNGCSSSLVGLKLDLGIPAMTTCCDQLDLCYDTCGTSKYDCDAAFRSCLLAICGDLKKSLGFVSQVRACDSMADVLYNTVWTLGCRPYMNSQRAACVCEGEEKDEL